MIGWLFLVLVSRSLCHSSWYDSLSFSQVLGVWSIEPVVFGVSSRVFRYESNLNSRNCPIPDECDPGTARFPGRLPVIGLILRQIEVRNLSFRM